MTHYIKDELDTIDWQLLTALQENARLSFKELGEMVNLSSTSVGHRIHQMEQLGIISGYHAAVNTKKLGFSILAFIRVTAVGANSYKLEEFARKCPDILECHKVTGVETFILKVTISSTEHLERLIDTLRRYSDPVTSIVLSSPVERRIIDRYDQQEYPLH